MAKLPEPDLNRLRALEPAIHQLPAAMSLARVYYAAGQYPSAWNGFRYWGPAPLSRFDHHQLDPQTLEPCGQSRGISYLAPLAITCVAEVFQTMRTINRDSGDPALCVLQTAAPLTLLDLTGVFATRMGASLAIHSGPRDRCRRWASALYAAYPEIQGLLYLSSMHPGGHAIALNERARGSLPHAPKFNRSLNDPCLTDLLDACAHQLGCSKS